MSIDQMLHDLVNREGGYTNHPNDKGGPTKFGITQATLTSWRGHPVTLQDVQYLTQAEAVAIYKKRYVSDPGFLQITSQALVDQLIDAGVNHGTTTASKLLQRALGVADDGVLGTNTISAANSINRDLLLLKFLSTRLSYYATILRNDVSQQVFAAGWLNRCAQMFDTYEKDCQSEAATPFTPQTLQDCVSISSYLRKCAFKITSHASKPASGTPCFKAAAAQCSAAAGALSA